MAGEYTTIEAAAERLGIGRTLAYQLAARDELPVPVIRLGKQYRIPTVALDRLAEGAPPIERAS